VTVVSAYRQLHGVTSLADLVGTVQLAPVPPAPGPSRTGVTIVVIGDSTAAGDGNAPVRQPTKQDTACDRSRDSYASDLQAVTGSHVLNLSCSSATIAHGLLGAQSTHGLTVLPQLSALEAVKGESAIIVSIGANDVGWQDFVYYCAVAQQCDDRATARLFQSRLDRFKIQYAQLLLRLEVLPGRPLVVINQYYDPFGGEVGCLQTDQTRSPTAVQPPSDAPGAPSPGNGDLLARARTLSSEISQLNAVLAQGAHAFHDVVVRPDFAGHTLCTEQPWVQGTSSPAPFHPNAAGELAIAAADLPRVIGATGVAQAPPR
jgi:lysophospholipase L1-like esterase